MSILSIAMRPNYTYAYFDVNAGQYTSYYKTIKDRSNFSTRAHFVSHRYKGIKPIPAQYINICVEGFLYKVDTDDSGIVMLFHLKVDNIYFLNKTVPSPLKNVASSFETSPSSRFRWLYENTAGPSS
jgi:hypothetical protein